MQPIFGRAADPSNPFGTILIGWVKADGRMKKNGMNGGNGIMEYSKNFFRFPVTAGPLKVLRSGDPGGERMPFGFVEKFPFITELIYPKQT